MKTSLIQLYLYIDKGIDCRFLNLKFEDLFFGNSISENSSNSAIMFIFNDLN